MSNEFNVEDLELNTPDELDVEVPEELDVEAPEDPGPALMGKTPVVGTLRRENDVPVLRDKLAESL